MNHPSTTQLQRLLAEELPADERERVEEHVNGCDACLERLEAWQRPPRSDRLLLAELLLRPPAEPGPPADGPAPAPARAGATAPLEKTLPFVAGPAAPDRPAFAGYEVLERVGSGGMGEVFRARHLLTGRVVALKTVLSGFGPAHGEYLARFRSEAEAVSRLQHANIISIYEVGEQDGRPFFTMEWVDGGNLAEQLAGKPRPPREAAALAETLARAVHAAHEAGVVHRDLKPANILLSGSDKRPRLSPGEATSGDACRYDRLTDCTPKVADFGLAKRLDVESGQTQTGQILGTPSYMAPEQTTGQARSVGPAADVYALGALLYEMLTGRAPFQGTNFMETLEQVRSREPVAVRSLQPKAPRDLETICLKCLSKEPHRRYATGLELADDLRRWLDGLPVLARPAGSAERLAKWGRRHPERAALVGLGTALIVALTAGLLWQFWAGNASYARQLANTADAQLGLIKYAVSKTAHAPEANLAAMLRDPAAHKTKLPKFLQETRDHFRDWFTRPDERQPIVNWFAMTADGTIVADSYDDPKSVGINYAFRDYYRGAAGSSADKNAVYLSHVYESEQDGRFKFTAVTRVWDAEGLAGLVAASIAVDSTMVGLDMKQEAAGARLVGCLDRNPKPGHEPADLPPFIVVLHRDYSGSEQRPEPPPPGQLATLEHLENDRTKAQATDRLSSGSVVDYARVGDSHFVVVVEQPYPWPLNVLLRWWVWWAVPLGAAALAWSGYRLRARAGGARGQA